MMSEALRNRCRQCDVRPMEGREWVRAWRNLFNAKFEVMRGRVRLLYSSQRERSCLRLMPIGK